MKFYINLYLNNQHKIQTYFYIGKRRKKDGVWPRIELDPKWNVFNSNYVFLLHKWTF